jgi:uncharacterized membrane protein
MSLLLGMSCAVLNITHCVSFKVVNDAKCHLIEIWFLKSKIKILLISLSLCVSVSLFGGGQLSQECVEEGRALNAQFYLEVTE